MSTNAQRRRTKRRSIVAKSHHTHTEVQHRYLRTWPVQVVAYLRPLLGSARTIRLIQHAAHLARVDVRVDQGPWVRTDLRVEVDATGNVSLAAPDGTAIASPSA